jgi:aryl-alcohol dehydrogenase-like predicted oxidoreductase
MQNMSFLLPALTDPLKNETVAKLSTLAKSLGGNVAQLSIAWALQNKQVSSVILGASNISQLQDNLGSIALKEKLTPDVMAAINQITQSVEIT